MKIGICVVPGCGNTKIKGYGLCSRCYQRWKRGTLEDESVLIRRGAKCIVDGCDNPSWSRGYCNAHYLRMAKGVSKEKMNLPIRAKQSIVRQCKAEDCNKQVGKRGGWGYCPSHYKQAVRKTNWERIIELKGGKCQRCGGVYPYTVYDLHHRDPSAKELSMANAIGGRVSWVVLSAEADKCDLLCANCHRVTHFGDGSGL